ncbi:MAG: branched-chain amino acid ABC transporter permease [Chloroflexi bacterium RBG_16_54_18]|nr:MAG: branched-chain amino acid ABC transporter permease [Chloroflexi bacterium RBG_16_54_18]
MSPQLAEFKAGVQAELPLLVGVVPFGMIYGVLAVEAGLLPIEAQAMSAIVFAGSAQFILTQLVSAGTPALVMVLTAAIVNLRHALYSASVAPYLRSLRPAWIFILAYLLTDEAYAVTIVHFTGSHSSSYHQRHYFLLGSGLALWSSWQLSTAAGIFLGALIPASWALDFTLPLIFIALVVPRITTLAAGTAAITAGIVSIFALDTPYRLGLVAASLAGIMAGMLVEGRKA